MLSSVFALAVDRFVTIGLRTAQFAKQQGMEFKFKDEVEIEIENLSVKQGSGGGI